MNDVAFLISDLARLLRRRFDERARLIGVTRPQWRLLVALGRHEGANQGTLAELLEVEPITLCRMVDRLEEAGLVERRRDPADRRAWRIHLTDRARPLIAHLSDLAETLLAQAFDGVSPERVQELDRVLRDVRSNLVRTGTEMAHG